MKSEDAFSIYRWLGTQSRLSRISSRGKAKHDRSSTEPVTIENIMETVDQTDSIHPTLPEVGQKKKPDANGTPRSARTPQKEGKFERGHETERKPRRLSKSVPPLGGRGFWNKSVRREEDIGSVTCTEVISAITMHNRPQPMRDNYTLGLPNINNTNSQESEKEKVRFSVDKSGHVSLVRLPVGFVNHPKTAPNPTRRSTGLTPRDVFRENQEVMSRVMKENVKRHRRRYKRRTPIDDRLKEFYKRIEVFKKDSANSELSDWEKKRRWVLMTQGIKAALDMSSDEEDNHT